MGMPESENFDLVWLSGEALRNIAPDQCASAMRSESAKQACGLQDGLCTS